MDLGSAELQACGTYIPTWLALLQVLHAMYTTYASCLESICMSYPQTVSHGATASF